MYSIQSFSQNIVETDYYANHPDLGGDVIINKSTKEIDENKAIVSFEVEAPTAGEYHVRFWLFPTKIYLVQLIIDGRVNVKKVIIK